VNNLSVLKHWFTSNTDQVLVLTFGILLVFGIILATIYFSKKAVILRKLRRFTAMAISGLQENKISKIIGKAKPVNEPLVAPLSGRKCVYYKVIVQQKSGDKNQHWREIIKEEEYQNFLVTSYAGSALILMTDFDDYFVEDKIYKSGHFNDATIKLQNYLELHGKKSLDFFGFNKTLRYKEAIIAVDEKIAVLGLVKYKNSSDYNIETSYSKIPVLQSQVNQKLILTDLPKALIDKMV